MAVTVTNSTIAEFETIFAVESNAATSTTDGEAEVFTIAPTKPGHSCVLIIGGTGSAADGDISFSVAAGDFWAGKEVSGTVEKNTEKMIELETASVMKRDGKILLTLTPAATDNLKTNHNAYVKFIQLR